MVYLDNYLKARNERLASEHKPARVLKGDRRKHVVHRVIDALGDWRFSKFEHEGAVRHGLRSAFCLDGHKWAVADSEASALVQEGLRRIGARRPDWIEGQWHYLTPRENCSWCGGEIDRRDWGSAVRFCSSLCARRSIDNRKFRDDASYERMRLAAYRTIWLQEAEARECRFCGTLFKSARAESEYCSPRCVRGARGDFHGDKDCVICGTTFHPQRMTINCCSNRCAGIYRAQEYREAYPERSCECCKAVFRPSKPGAMYCSRSCASTVMGRRFRERQRLKRQAAVVQLPIFTLEIFDGWFKKAA